MVSYDPSNSFDIKLKELLPATLWTVAGATALWFALPGDVAWWRVALRCFGFVVLLFAGVTLWTLSWTMRLAVEIHKFLNYFLVDLSELNERRKLSPEQLLHRLEERERNSSPPAKD